MYNRSDLIASPNREETMSITRTLSTLLMASLLALTSACAADDDGTGPDRAGVDVDNGAGDTSDDIAPGDDAGDDTGDDTPSPDTGADTAPDADAAIDVPTDVGADGSGDDTGLADAGPDTADIGTDTVADVALDVPADGSGDAAPPCDPDTDPTCPGAAMPAYVLEDVQPQSDRFGETYGLDAFRGEVTVVAILASWCSFCQSQIQELEGMSVDLALSGYTVNFVAINQTGAEDTLQNFLDRCSFPILQDVAEVDAWGAHTARKDDIFIYAADGSLAEFIRVSGLPSDIRTLASEAGYDWMRGRIIAAFAE